MQPGSGGEFLAPYDHAIESADSRASPNDSRPVTLTPNPCRLSGLSECNAVNRCYSSSMANHSKLIRAAVTDAEWHKVKQAALRENIPGSQWVAQAIRKALLKGAAK